MIDLLHNVVINLINQLRLHPLTSAVLILLIALASFNATIRDFLNTFQKRPAQFVPFRWSTLLRQPTADVPLVELGQTGHVQEALAQGSKLFPDGPFKITLCSHQVVILPHKWSNVVKSCSAKTLNFQQFFFDLALGDYTGITSTESHIMGLLRQNLVRLFDRVQPLLASEASNYIDFEIELCEGWTTVVLLPKIIQVINKISALVFVGEPLCQDERWLQSRTVIARGTFGALPALWQSNRFVRPFAAWRHPALREVRKEIDRSRELLAPVLEQRLKSTGIPNTKPPADLMQLVLDDTHDSRSRSLDYHVKLQTDAGRAALVTTGTTCFHVVYHLAERPEYIEPIRQEIMSVIEGSMDRVNATKLVKLDSFIRECQRWYSLAQLGPMRKVQEPFQLPDGTELPVGTYVALDAQKAVFDESGLDSPYEFDGFRFEKMRAVEGNENKFQAATPSLNNLAFGYGSPTCPGRYYAVQEIKLVVAHIVTHYDFKLKEQPVQTPLTWPEGLLTFTDPNVEFLFKRRT